MWPVSWIDPGYVMIIPFRKVRRKVHNQAIRLERTPDKREVGGSIPPRPTMIGGLAQLGERLPCTQEVSGSIPLSSTT